MVYARDGQYVEPALIEINEFLGDFRTGELITIDPALLDFIYDIRTALGGTGTYEVISAYRSPETNEMLRSRGSGVVRNSQHLLGNDSEDRQRGTDDGVSEHVVRFYL